MSQPENSANVSRSDFLRLAALGAGGLGLASIAGCSPPAVSGSSARPGSVVVISNGPNDANRAMLGLICATKLPKGDNHVWFVLGGVQIAKKGEAEKLNSEIFAKQGPATKLLDEIKSQGTKIHACPVCAAFFAVQGDAKIDGLDEKGGDWLMEMAATHNMAWF